jgi:hypothetical protein
MCTTALGLNYPNADRDRGFWFRFGVRGTRLMAPSDDREKTLPFSRSLQSMSAKMAIASSSRDQHHIFSLLSLDGSAPRGLAHVAPELQPYRLSRDLPQSDR